MDNKQPLWLCIYQYRGHETEGHLSSKELFVCRASDIIEALYKYHIWDCWRESNLKRIVWQSLSDYRKSEYADGGWGFTAYKLEECDDNARRRDDTGAFYSVYEAFNH